MPSLNKVNHKYKVIYADPPWPESTKERWSGEKVEHRRPVPKYETLSMKQITSLPVSQIASESSLLLLWSPWMRLKTSIRLMEDWGFHFSSGMPWVKWWDESRTKTVKVYGRWTMPCTECLLIGYAGKAPKPKHLVAGLLESFGSRRGLHSAKPDQAIDYIEQNFDGPYLEMFARVVRPGWDVWGNEVECSPGTEVLTCSNQSVAT